MKPSFAPPKIRSPEAYRLGGDSSDGLMSSNRFPRARRRAQRTRRKVAIVRRVRATPWMSAFLDDPNLLAHYVGVSAATRARCSCWMCCNPRRALKNSSGAQTIQEVRQAARQADWDE